MINRISDLERQYVLDVLSGGFKSSSGATYMRKFETTFANRFGAQYAISFVNGTATMHAALEAYGIGPGDEVIVPPLTMSSTTFAVLQANATPVFADVNLDTFQICAESIKSRVTDRTKAIITVALYGLSPDMDPIRELARNRGIRIIEDNAECFLGYYKDRIVGTLGDCASFSFQSSKHLTSGEGGIVITDDAEFAENIRRVQSLGYAGVGASKAKITKADIQHPDYSRHVSMGWNYRMPELCCAVALAQTERIDELVSVRQQCALVFSEATKDFHSWFVPQVVPPQYTNSYWTWVCKLTREDVSWTDIRNRFIELGGDGVYAAWKLTYMEPMFVNQKLLGREKFISKRNLDGYTLGICPNAEYLQPRLFQFKTNYWNVNECRTQASLLQKTLSTYM